jgi:hypothetical protein
MKCILKEQGGGREGGRKQREVEEEYWSGYKRTRIQICVCEKNHIQHLLPEGEHYR